MWRTPSSASMRGSGFLDNTGGSDGISSYAVAVTDAASGAVVAARTVTDSKATVTNLVDGAAYLVAVVAANPVGAGPAVTSDEAVPVAVPGGPARHIPAVAGVLNAADRLQAGQARSTADAVAGTAAREVIEPEVGVYAAGNVAVDNARWQLAQGSYFVPSTGLSKPGDIVYTDQGSGGWRKISHAGIIVKVVGRNVYIDQHSSSHNYHTALLKATSKDSWGHRHPKEKIWIVEPMMNLNS